MGRLSRLWFSLERPVGPRDYALSGALLVPLKLAIDNAIWFAGHGEWWSPIGYLNPFYSARFQDRQLEWPILALAAALIPFLWIGLSLTLRRLRDARMAPGLAFLFFVPGINYVMMFLLCFRPSRIPKEAWRDGPHEKPPGRWTLILTSALAGAMSGMLVFVFAVYAIQSYGLGLFVGAPVLMGAVSSYLLARRTNTSAAGAIRVGILAVVIASISLLMFALEGLVCLIMAAPLALPLGIVGALLGWSASRPRLAVSAGVFLLIPLLFAADSARESMPLREVLTSLEVAAPAEIVWQNVVAFSELPEPTDWLFATGIAYPIRARIDGEGVGAVRYCEFSTGPFVEPITAWEPPHRLAFDVRSNPQALDELSPFSNVLAPHLRGGFTSHRGEFRLIPLGDGRTRIEGRTWYRVDFAPTGYWTLWSDQIVHRIHRRVLRHVEALSRPPQS